MRVYSVRRSSKQSSPSALPQGGLQVLKKSHLLHPALKSGWKNTFGEVNSLKMDGKKRFIKKTCAKYIRTDALNPPKDWRTWCNTAPLPGCTNTSLLADVLKTGQCFTTNRTQNVVMECSTPSRKNRNTGHHVFVIFSNENFTMELLCTAPWPPRPSSWCTT